MEMVTYLLLFFFAAVVHGSHSRQYKEVLRIEKENVTTEALNGVYCFHYTWLADMNNETFAPFIDKTCSDKYALVKPMPLCVNPMVVTDNSQEPDSTWLINNQWSKVRCKLSEGYTCAKYSYRFNGKVQNVTRYCAKITVNELPMDSGCVVADHGAYETEVCACNQMLGRYPCNAAPGISTMFFVSVLSLCWLLILR